MENGEKGTYFEAISVPKDWHEFYEADKAEARKANREQPLRGTVVPEGMLLPPPKPFESVEPFGKSYKPLVATPYLFLDFARIVERKSPQQAALDWISKYGLLGIQPRNHAIYEIDISGTRAGTTFEKEYSQRGGEQETLARFLNEASRANRILASYEAALARDVEQLEQIAFEEEIDRGELEEHLQLEARLTGGDYADVLVDWVIVIHILEDVQEVLKDLTFPSIVHRGTVDRNYSIGTVDRSVIYPDGLPKIDMRNRLWAPERLVRSYQPRNLLGAMYLQFYWLITSGAEVARCRHCGKLIPHDPPMPGSGRKRKAHKNKEYCDDRCRQNYHYHNVVKPKRNAKRNGGNK